jgi:hypothetical protein
MPDTHTLVHAIRSQWQAEGINYRPGVSLTVLREFERKRHVSLPADLRSYLLILDGFAEGEYDRHQIRFWPLEEFSELAARGTNGANTFCVFADFLIHSHFYAVNIGDEFSLVELVGGPDRLPIASTFSEFLGLYIHDPPALFQRDPKFRVSSPLTSPFETNDTALASATSTARGAARPVPPLGPHWWTSRREPAAVRAAAPTASDPRGPSGARARA